MKITNFRNFKTVGTNALDWVFFADVDVTTGILFKKTNTRRVSRAYGSGFWIFVDDGNYCPGLEVERMERGHKAREKDK